MQRIKKDGQKEKKKRGERVTQNELLSTWKEKLI